MEVSKKIGKLAAKTVKGITAAPKATTGKLSQVKDNLAEGWHEVVPAKTKNQ